MEQEERNHPPSSQGEPEVVHDVTYSEIVIGKLRFKITTTVKHNEKIAAEAEEYLAQCAARNIARRGWSKRANIDSGGS